MPNKGVHQSFNRQTARKADVQGLLPLLAHSLLRLTEPSTARKKSTVLFHTGRRDHGEVCITV